MIRPTLFIGLGTTGLKITQFLRQFVFEQFGRLSLPCFKYCVIETDNNIEVDNLGIKERINTNDEIKLIKTPIQNFNDIRTVYIDPDRNSEYRTWLDPGVFSDFQHIQAFNDGASRMRSIGRLALWQNIGRLREIGAFANAISQPDVIDQTTMFLQTRYPNVPVNQIFANNYPNIYIYGTLCAGTCSGMFIDVAYYLHNYLRSRLPIIYGAGYNQAIDNRPKIYGILTIPDANMLANLNDYSPVGANSYGALEEFEESLSIQNNFTIKTGNAQYLDLKQLGANRLPLDILYIISPQNQHQTIRDHNGNFGEIAEKEFDQMIAMSLFGEVTVGGLSEAKNATRTNYLASPAFYDPDWQNQAVNISNEGHFRNYTAFGLVSLHYPKFQVIGGAAYEICRDLSLYLNNQANINYQSDAERFFNEQIVDDIKLRVLAPYIGNIENQFAVGRTIRRAKSLDKFNSNLMAAAKNLTENKYDNFVGALSINSYFCNKIKDDINNLRFRDTIDIKQHIVNKIVTEIKKQFDQKKDIHYTRCFLNSLQDIFNNWKNKYRNLSNINLYEKETIKSFSFVVWSLDMRGHAVNQVVNLIQKAVLKRLEDLFSQLLSQYLDNVFQIQDIVQINTQLHLIENKFNNDTQNNIFEMITNNKNQLIQNIIEGRFVKIQYRRNNPCLNDDNATDADKLNAEVKMLATVIEQTEVLQNKTATCSNIFNGCGNLFEYFANTSTEQILEKMFEYSLQQAEANLHFDLRTQIVDPATGQLNIPLNTFANLVEPYRTLIPRPELNNPANFNLGNNIPCYVCGPHNLINDTVFHGYTQMPSYADNFLILYKESIPFVFDELGNWEQLQQCKQIQIEGLNGLPPLSKSYKVYIWQFYKKLKKLQDYFKFTIIFDELLKSGTNLFYLRNSTEGGIKYKHFNVEITNAFNTKVIQEVYIRCENFSAYINDNTRMQIPDIFYQYQNQNSKEAFESFFNSIDNIICTNYSDLAAFVDAVHAAINTKYGSFTLTPQLVREKQLLTSLIDEIINKYFHLW
jgi:hypothetical protein